MPAMSYFILEHRHYAGSVRFCALLVTSGKHERDVFLALGF
jgi:hypothetical protein